MKEEAKAVQEVAKTAGQAIEATRKFGNFVARYIDGTLEQATGLVEDRLSYMRWERQIRYMRRAEEFLAQQGLKHPTRLLPLSIGIPLFQAASLQEDDELQDIWARLLVNGVDAESGVQIRRAFVSILEDFGRVEAQILDRILQLSPPELENGVSTAELPSRAIPLDDDGKAVTPRLPSEEVQLALWNLIRLGCLSTAMTWGGGQTIAAVYITPIGRALVAACKLRPKPQPQ